MTMDQRDWLDSLVQYPLCYYPLARRKHGGYLWKYAFNDMTWHDTRCLLLVLRKWKWIRTVHCLQDCSPLWPISQSTVWRRSPVSGRQAETVSFQLKVGTICMCYKYDIWECSLSAQRILKSKSCCKQKQLLIPTMTNPVLLFIR